MGALMRKLLVVAWLAGLLAAQDPDWTVVVVPDPQMLPTLAKVSQYKAMMQYVIDSATTWNTKVVIGVGDVNNCGTNDGGARGGITLANSAWQLLDAAGIPWITPPGNHDLVNRLALPSTACPGGVTPCIHNMPGYAFDDNYLTAHGSDLSVSGADVSAGRQFIAGDVGKTLGITGGGAGCANDAFVISSVAGGVATLDASPGNATNCNWYLGYGYISPTLRSHFSYWGGSLDSTNTSNWYIKLTVGSRKIAICAMELFPGPYEYTAWETVHDSLLAQGYEVWLTTHANVYSSSPVRLAHHDDPYTIDGTGHYGFLPLSDAACVSDPNDRRCAMAPDEGWSTYLVSWRNLVMVFNGHYPDGPSRWGVTTTVSTAMRKQTVVHTLVDYQNLESGGEGGYLMFLKMKPSADTMEVYLYSSVGSHWMGAGGSFDSATPVVKQTVTPMPRKPVGMFPLPGSVIR